MPIRPSTVERPFELLRRARPASPLPLTAGIDAALDELAQSITAETYSPLAPHVERRRFRPRVKVVVVVAAVALMAGGVATAAGVLPVYSGVFASGGNVDAGGPGENMNMAAPDFGSAALKLSSDIPYPAGYAAWRDWVVTEQAPGPGQATAGDQVTTGALRGWFAASAFCAWVQDWRQATLTGNTTEAAAAASTISAAPNWSAVTAEDPNPSALAPNDPGAEPGTLFGWLLPYRSAVLAGDSATVTHLLASGYGDGKCWLADPQWATALKAHPSWSRLAAHALGQRYRWFLADTRP